MWRVPNSARMLLPAEAQPQLRPTPLEEEVGTETGREERGRQWMERSGENNTADSNSIVPF